MARELVSSDEMHVSDVLPDLCDNNVRLDC